MVLKQLRRAPHTDISFHFTKLVCIKGFASGGEKVSPEQFLCGKPAGAEAQSAVLTLSISL